MNIRRAVDEAVNELRAAQDVQPCVADKRTLCAHQRSPVIRSPRKSAPMDRDFESEICLVAQWAKAHHHESVTVWMMRHLTSDIHADRTQKPCKRGIQVQLNNRRKSKATLDLDRVRELAEETQP